MKFGPMNQKQSVLVLILAVLTFAFIVFEEQISFISENTQLMILGAIFLYLFSTFVHVYPNYKDISIEFLKGKERDLKNPEGYLKYLKRLNGYLKAIIISEAEKGLSRDALKEDKLRLVQEEMERVKGN